MTPQIPSPTKGQPMRASWAAQVTDVCNAFRAASFAGTMTRDGAGAFGNAPLPENKRNRRGSERVHPFEVRWASGENEGEGAWTIWLPDITQMVLIGDEYVVPTGVTPAESLPEGWYVIDDATAESTEVCLVVTPPEETDGEEPSTPAYTAAISAAPESEDADADPSEAAAEEEETDAKRILIATLEARKVTQIVDSVITIRGTSEPPKLDEVSIDDLAGENGGEIEIAHFADDEMDSGKGLASRLSADPETGEITSNDDSGLMLVGRKGGKIVYVPLSGNTQKPVDEEYPPKPGGTHCDHDSVGGRAGGVESNGGGGGGGIYFSGGVEADGDSHAGDDNCNCD